MEFEKLQEIIADVLNVDPNEVTMETTFADDLDIKFFFNSHHNLKYIQGIRSQIICKGCLHGYFIRIYV